ncbi:hypothetical protein IXO89_13145 [Xanthomonas oryzae pv. oryzae]|nr:hypothetical protein IXO89_13145 [Xanthomonas oryzae pv. oryzae]
MRGFFSTEMRRACAPDAMHRGGQSAALDPRPFRLSAIGYRLSASQHDRGTRDSTGGEQNRAQVFPLLFRLQNACTPADVKETLG